MGKESSPKSFEIARYRHSNKHLWDDTDLRHVAVDPINDEYWYGNMGKVPIVLDMQTGYIGATHACEQYGADFDEWEKTEHAKELIAYLASDTGLNPADLVVKIVDDYPDINGKYVHPDLISIIISWAFPSFGSTMSQIIIKYISQEASDLKEDAAIRKQSRRE